MQSKKFVAKKWPVFMMQYLMSVYQFDSIIGSALLVLNQVMSEEELYNEMRGENSDALA